MLPRQKWTRQNVTRQNVTRQIVTRQNVAEPFFSARLTIILNIFFQIASRRVMHGKFYKLLILPCRRILNLQLFFLWCFLHLRILRLCKYIQIENNPWLWKLKHIRKFSKKKFLNFTLKGVFAKNERGYRSTAMVIATNLR